MYLIYWVKPNGSIGTTKVEISADLYDWTEYWAKHLRCQPYVYVSDGHLWGTFINMYVRGKTTSIEKDWIVTSPATVPPEIRAYHLLTHWGEP